MKKWSKQQRAEAAERMRKLNAAKQQKKQQTAQWCVRGYAECHTYEQARDIASSWQVTFAEPLTITIDIQRIDR